MNVNNPVRLHVRNSEVFPSLSTPITTQLPELRVLSVYASEGSCDAGSGAGSGACDCSSSDGLEAKGGFFPWSFWRQNPIRSAHQAWLRASVGT